MLGLGVEGVYSFNPLFTMESIVEEKGKHVLAYGALVWSSCLYKIGDHVITIKVVKRWRVWVVWKIHCRYTATSTSWLKSHLEMIKCSSSACSQYNYLCINFYKFFKSRYTLCRPYFPTLLQSGIGFNYMFLFKTKTTKKEKLIFLTAPLPSLLNQTQLVLPYQRKLK